VKDQANGLIGTGTDTITVRAATKNTPNVVSNFTLKSSISATGTIASALHGDTVTIADTTTFLSTPLTATASSLASIVSTAMGALPQHNVGWFNWGGNTYLLEQANASNSAFGNGDTLVQITGTLDLSHATLANHVITL
jgi:S-layer protein